MTESVGPYRLTQLIGRGGTGEVWLATDIRNGRRVAVKLLDDRLLADPGQRARFEREVEAAARIEHPHLLPVWDFSAEGRPYIAMPYLRDSTDLGTMLRAGPLEPGRAVNLVGQVASALDAVHRAGLAHRDVKPSNILVSRDGEHVQLTDYGVVQQPADDPAPGHVVVGTVAYLAPERFTGGASDDRADVYALAVTLYEALAGRTPFVGDTQEVVSAHLGSEPPPLPAGIPPELAAVVAKGLAKNPDDRWQSAGEFAAAAQAAISEPQPEAPSVAYEQASSRAATVPAAWPLPPVRTAAGLLVIIVGVVLVATADGSAPARWIGAAAVAGGVVTVAVGWVRGRSLRAPVLERAPVDLDLPVLDVAELTVYTSGDDGEPLRDAVVELLEVAGFQVVDRDAPVRGSWFQRLFVRHKNDAAVRKLGELAEEAVRAAQLKYIASPRSESDEREANAIARLTEAMSTVDDAVVCTSSILLIKSEGRLVARVLTEAEIRTVQRNPELLRAPEDLLRALTATPEPAAALSVAHAPQPCPDCGQRPGGPTGPSCAACGHD